MTETSLEPGRAFLSMASSSASEGCCCGGEASEAEEEEVEVENNASDDDEDGDLSVDDVNAAPPLLLLQLAELRESAVRAAATREFMAGRRKGGRDFTKKGQQRKMRRTRSNSRREVSSNS